MTRVDLLWERLRFTVGGLQSAGRLPTEAVLYDPRLAVVRQYLATDSLSQAWRESRRVAKQYPAAGVVAFELIKTYLLAHGDTARAGDAALEAVTLLRTYERQQAKLQRKRRRER